MKSQHYGNQRASKPSPPARGAWIEICMRTTKVWRGLVAPREGGVD